MHLLAWTLFILPNHASRTCMQDGHGTTEMSLEDAVLTEPTTLIESWAHLHAAEETAYLLVD